MADVTAIKPVADPDVVKALEGWLENAKAGEYTGVVLLANMRGDEIMHGSAGDFPLSRAMLVFEQYKLRQLVPQMIQWIRGADGG